MTTPAICTCRFDCGEHPDTACALSGRHHTHPDDGSHTEGPCPIHPDAPASTR